MKICHVITRLVLGGARENTLLTCEGLRARGHEVTLITGPPLGPEARLPARAEAGGYRVIVIDQMRRQINPFRDRPAYRRLLRCLRDLRPDIVHSHRTKAGILARRAAAAVGGMRIVHTIHGLPFHPHQPWLVNRFYIAMERRAARVTDAIISVADAMTGQALAAGVGQADQYTTVYSGMEVAPFLAVPDETAQFRKAMNLPSDAVLVTQVSPLARLKGHEYILAAAERITDDRVHFCLVGDGNLRREIQAQIARRDLAGRFHLAGAVQPDRMSAVMHASDIVVHCSVHEGLARAIPQGMLACKPVVSFDVDGARDLVAASTGILLEPKDVGGLALAVEILAASPQLRETLGRAGRAKCRELFDHNRMVEQIQKLYERIL